MSKRNYEPKPLFIERMQKLLPDENDFKNYLNIIKKEPVNSIRCNTLKISIEKLKKRLEEKNWKIKQPFKDFPEIMIVEGKFEEAVASDINYSVNKKLNGVDNSPIKTADKFGKYINNKKISVSINNDKNQLLSDNNFRVGNSMSQGGNNRAERDKLQSLFPGELGRSLEHQLGYYYIQEISSMLSILALNPKPNEIILDLCSSPGSKTTQMASFMKNTGTIIANEKNFGRIKILASNLQRCGVLNCIITKKDGIDLCKTLKENNIQLDKILVDAPCSGEGTIRSSPKTLIMWNIKMIKSLSKLQKALLSSAIETLKPDGELIYSTCTHAPEENEEVVDFVLSKFKDEIRIEKISLPVKCRQGITNWNNKSFNSEIKKCCRIYPQDNNTEGFFISKFKKIKEINKDKS